MLRIAISGLVGGLVYFVWGNLTWMLIPLHMPTVSGLPNEAAVTAALKAQDLESGVYIAPWTDDEEEWQDPESDFMKNHQAGPLYSVFYHRDGLTPMSPAIFGGGLVVAVLGALVASVLLCMALPLKGGFLGRVGFVTGLGLFVAIVAHLGYWNWMHFATDWTVAWLIDVTVGWALAGLAIAAIVKPREDVALDTAEA